jgi:hypothetical protein
MKSPYLRLITFSLIVALVGALPVSAADKKKKKEPSEPIVSTVAAVNGNVIDITTGTATKTLKMSQFTEVRVNGQKGSPADLKPGMTVSEVVLGADPSVASRINAAGSALPIETPTPEKKKRKKKEPAAE